MAVVLAVASKLESRIDGVRELADELHARRRPRGRERLAVAAVLAAAATGLGLPLAVLVQRSRGAWHALFDETPALLVTPWHAAVNSLLFATAATAIALAVGGLTAVALARLRPGAVDALVLLPLGVSAVMLGFGFLITFDEPPIDFRSSWWLVPVAQSLVAAPFVVRIVAPSLRAIDPRLHEAAAVLGASPPRAWREIDLPLAARAFGTAAGFAFAIALGEFGATVFLARADRPTLPVAIFRFLGRAGAENQSLAAALAVTLAGLAVIAALVAERAASGRRSADLMLTTRAARVVFEGHPAVDGVDLDVGSGETVAVLGPSGCGKSTLLRAVAGLQRLDAGTIVLDGRDLAGVPAYRRGIGLMFQDDALFPHRDVLGNVGFGLRMEGLPAPEARARVSELLELVGLAGTERRSVRSLSGGERKRVALARALAPRPRMLLLDEPLGALDRPLHDRLLEDLRAAVSGSG